MNQIKEMLYCQWFSQGTPASCTSKTGCHDLAEILLKMALNTKKSHKFNRLVRAFSALFRSLSVAK
jgi:hypothetical protein